MVKKTRMPAGSVRKFSLAVLVDQQASWQPDGKVMKRVLVPPTPETMKVIHDLVAGVTGYNEQRGDQLVIETLPFESTLQLEPPPAPVTPGAANKPCAGRNRRVQLPGQSQDPDDWWRSAALGTIVGGIPVSQIPPQEEA